MQGGIKNKIILNLTHNPPKRLLGLCRLFSLHWHWKNWYLIYIY